jgi:chemotaxis protein MotB
MASAAAPGPGDNLPPIIVKKVIVQGGGHHGGAWKVAYADFVTAMMAFFLLLWLLGSTTEDQRKGLADFFTPTLVKVKEGSAGSDGLLGGASLVDTEDMSHQQGQTGTQALTIPRDATGGPREGAGTIKRSERITEMRKEIAEKLAAAQSVSHLANQVKLVDTTRGIRIDLVDDANFSMFRLGTTILTPEANELVRIIAETISTVPSQLIVRGHTDSLQWKSDVQANNWSLSSARADSTRRALELGGVGSDRFFRIEGVADREPLIRNDPADPRNRRISIHMID